MNFQYPVSRIRFGEFDLGGVLYHANYFHVYEMAREAFLAAGPIAYEQLVKLRCHLALVESRQKFLKPIRYGENFEVSLSTSKIGRATADIQYTFKKDRELHRAVTSLVFIRSESATFSVEPFPAKLREYFSSYEEAPIF